MPSNASLILYSLDNSDYFTYDLTSSLQNTSAVGLWQNLTIPVGSSASGWMSTGSPTWDNITALQFNFNYASASNITIRIGSLFFRGQYQSPVQFEGLQIGISALEEFSFQFILTWFLITGLIYLFFRGFKAPITWKPVFTAAGLAMFVMVIRALVNFFAALTLPVSYYSYDVALGAGSNILGALTYPSQYVYLLMAQSQGAVNSILSATSGFGYVILALFVVSYVWLGYLLTIAVGYLNPAFSMTRRISIAGVSVAVTIFVLLLFSVPI